MSLSAHAIPPGSYIDRYRIIKRLAVGGMAEIYLACATGIEGFEKRVVLKRILPQFACRSEFVGMFLDEARLAATLHHPNIAQVYDIGTDEETYYFTMEYVEGRDVRHIRKRTTALDQDVPLDQTIAITMGVAAGLHAAHEKRGPDGTPLGIVHRDVSPANVIVTYDGNVKLIDFGIAKAKRRQTNTRTGILKGKSCSMSPEQCLAGPIDRRSDIFSLGILLYEMSTATRLFGGHSEFETMRMIVDGRVEPPSRRRPEYPEMLEQIVMRALERDPDDRYQTAQEMFIDLDCFAREERLAVAPYNLAAYLRQLFPDDGNEVEGSSPPLFLLGDDAELPDELRGLSADDLGAGELSDGSIEISMSGEFDANQSLERAQTVDLAVHRAVSPALEALGLEASGGGDDEPTAGSAPRRAKSPSSIDSAIRRATTMPLATPDERRLPSEEATSLLKMREARAQSSSIFRSRISMLALFGSVALAGAVLAFGLLSDNGWFATGANAEAVEPALESAPMATAERHQSALPDPRPAPTDVAADVVAAPIATGAGAEVAEPTVAEPTVAEPAVDVAPVADEAPAADEAPVADEAPAADQAPATPAAAVVDDPADRRKRRSRLSRREAASPADAAGAVSPSARSGRAKRRARPAPKPTVEPVTSGISAPSGLSPVTPP